jgi:hypothetical protein
MDFVQHYEKVPTSVVTTAKDKPVRVDHYWREMLSITTADGTLKYPFLSMLVKTALVLPRSNADVERSLSVNNRTVTMDKTQLGETAINGPRSTKDYVKSCDPAAMRTEKICIKKLAVFCKKSIQFVQCQNRRKTSGGGEKEQAILDENLTAERLLNAKKTEDLIRQ